MKHYEIAIFGGSYVGKSTFINRFLNNYFYNYYNKLTTESYKKNMKINGESILLEIHDTDESEKYSPLRESFIREGVGFILMYSIDSKDSFEKIKILKDHICSKIKDYDHIPIVIVGNKCDLEEERKVDIYEASELARLWKVHFFESSSKKGIIIEEPIYQLISELKSKLVITVEDKEKEKNKCLLS